MAQHTLPNTRGEGEPHARPRGVDCETSRTHYAAKQVASPRSSSLSANTNSGEDGESCKGHDILPSSLLTFLPFLFSLLSSRIPPFSPRIPPFSPRIPPFTSLPPLLLFLPFPLFLLSSRIPLTLGDTRAAGARATRVARAGGGGSARAHSGRRSALRRSLSRGAQQRGRSRTPTDWRTRGLAEEASRGSVHARAFTCLARAPRRAPGPGLRRALSLAPTLEALQGTEKGETTPLKHTQPQLGSQRKRNKTARTAQPGDPDIWPDSDGHTSARRRRQNSLGRQIILWRSRLTPAKHSSNPSQWRPEVSHQLYPQSSLSAAIKVSSKPLIQFLSLHSPLPGFFRTSFSSITPSPFSRPPSRCTCPFSESQSSPTPFPTHFRPSPFPVHFQPLSRVSLWSFPKPFTSASPSQSPAPCRVVSPLVPMPISRFPFAGLESNPCFFPSCLPPRDRHNRETEVGGLPSSGKYQ
ncbi:hypothetical protein C7M84_024151 [Penaeus vannamei]|uniref:Uncharacterized protein n=1 Tax=Penaeus vannamei TaxID=6689 RepID=A0A423U1V8_PENVA|nr:hypothetical protein C7M84_024151 [Penaeus vannamei]